MRPHDGASISEASHRLLAGWRVTRNGETISPETALVSSQPPTAAKRALVARLQQQHQP